MALRTTGRTNSNTGNAISHEALHAPNHLDVNCGDMPMPMSVLINDTRHDIMMDSSNGMIKGP